MAHRCAFVLNLEHGEPECGEPAVFVSLLGKAFCDRHAPACRHRRQTWWGIKLPCVERWCYEGFDGPRLEIAAPMERRTFRAATLPMSSSNVPDCAIFEREEWADAAGNRRWLWIQKAGPRPPEAPRG